MSRSLTSAAAASASPDGPVAANATRHTGARGPPHDRAHAAPRRPRRAALVDAFAMAGCGTSRGAAGGPRAWADSRGLAALLHRHLLSVPRRRPGRAPRPHLDHWTAPYNTTWRETRGTIVASADGLTRRPRSRVGGPGEGLCLRGRRLSRARDVVARAAGDARRYSRRHERRAVTSKTGESGGWFTVALRWRSNCQSRSVGGRKLRTSGRSCRHCV